MFFDHANAGGLEFSRERPQPNRLEDHVDLCAIPEFVEGWSAQRAAQFLNNGIDANNLALGQIHAEITVNQEIGIQQLGH